MNTHEFLMGLYSNEHAMANAVVEQIGGEEAFEDNAPDVARYGATGGVSGFTYYADTVPFARKNQRAIMRYATEQAQEFGVGVVEMIAGFNCLRDTVTPFVVADVLINGDTESPDATAIYNALAWYALEETCRKYADMIEA
jgi:hypothetical protein